MYPEVESEMLVDEFYKVDMFIPSKNVVIEVQGPYHLNGLGINNKKTLLKAKILRKLGFNFCELSTIEFNNQKFNFKENYIMQRIRHSLMTT